MKKLLLQAAVLGLVLFGIVQIFDVLKDNHTEEVPTEVVVEEVKEETKNEPVKYVAPAKNNPVVVVTDTTSDVVVDNTEPAVLNSTRVEVFAYEYDFDFSEKQVPAGQVIFSVRNTGVTSHSFAIEGKQDFGKVNPGETKTFVTNLSEGEWEVYSTKTRDADAGMRETLTVR